MGLSELWTGSPLGYIVVFTNITLAGLQSLQQNLCLLHCKWILYHWLTREAPVTSPDSILKSKDTTLSTKIHIIKAMVFPVFVYGCESWTIKKAEHWRIDAFKLWCWRRLLTVPRTARRSNQSILKEINCEYSLEGLTLKPQNYGHLMQRGHSLKKTLMLVKIEGNRRRR